MRPAFEMDNGIDFTLIPAEDETTQADLSGQQELMRRLPVNVADGVRLGRLGKGMTIGSIQASGAGPLTFDIHTALSALPTLGAAFAAWIGARSGRKVRVKVGDIEVEAGTAAEASALLQQAQQAKNKGE